ncbi:MAG TPA: hypothetical protein VI685_08070, partial [Candidatus Angelobacter sp.]
EFNVTHGPEAINTLGNMTLMNPDSFHEINDSGVKSQVSQWLMDRGLPAPKKLNAQTQQGEDAATVALSNIDRVRTMLADPVIQRNLGPITGRVGNLEQDIGASLRGASSEDLQKIQDFRTSLNYLFFQEGKALFGGRPPQQLMKEFEKTNANPKMVLPMLTGSLNGAEQSAKQRINVAMSQRFGGKVPPQYGSIAGPPGSVAPIRLKNGNTLTPHDAAAAAQFRKDHPERIAP